MGMSMIMLAAGLALATPASEAFNRDPQDTTRQPRQQSYQAAPPAAAPSSDGYDTSRERVKQDDRKHRHDAKPKEKPARPSTQ